MNTSELGGTAWRTSSYSTNGGNCVEVAWRKSSHSSTNGDCVEVARIAPGTLVRDTKDRDGGILEVPPASWAAFTSQMG